MATELITAFNGGEASRNLESRKDLDFYKRLCSVAENVDILSEGGAITRAGSKYIADTKSGKAYVREFSYSDDYAYVLEIGDEYMRIYNSTTEAVVETSITTPWDITEVPELDFYRSYDVMWICHSNHPTQVLTRTSTSSFSLAEIEFDYPPLLEQNITDTTLTVSHTTGTSRALTASADYFNTDSPSKHIGAIFAINHERDATQSSINSGVVTGTGTSSALDVSFCNWRVETGGTWNGYVVIERSTDGGSTWVAGERIGDTRNIAAANFSFDSVAREGANTQIRLSYTSIAASGGGSGMSFNITCQDLYTYGLVEITAVTDAQNATCDVISTIGATTATKRWSEGAFSDLRGYPRTVDRHEDRLVFSGTEYEPNMQWFSFTGDYYNFYVGTLDDEAIRRAPPVNGYSSWMISKGDLFIGTDKELITVVGYNPNQPITPENFKYNVESSFGGAYRQPVLANNVVLYLQKNEQTIREILYDDNSKSYRSQDLSRIAKHIVGEGVNEISLMRLPEQRLHCILDNGEKGVLTYERTEEVVAWRRYVTDGDYISSCVVDGGSEDVVWNVVLRDGTYMLEKEMSRSFSGTDYWCVDSAVNSYLTTPTSITDISLDGTDVVVTSTAHGLSNSDIVRIISVAGMAEVNEGIYTVSDKTDDTFKLKYEDGSAYIDGSSWTAYISGGIVTEVSNTLTGLSHLNGETVAVVGDGIYDGDHTVSAGSVTLNDYYNRLVGGLKYESTISPMPIEPDLMDRNSSGKNKLINGKVVLKLKNTIGGSFGSILGKYEKLIGETAPNLGQASTLVNDDVEVYSADGWDDIKRVYFKQTLPFPAELLSMVITLDVRS